MFRFELISNNTTTTINPLNKSSIVFVKAKFENNCLGYRTNCESDIIVSDKQMFSDGVLEKVSEWAVQDSTVSRFIKVYDESENLYYSGRFTSKNINYNLNDCIYSIKLETYDDYTNYLKNKDLEFNLYTFILDRYEITDISSSGVFEQNITSGFKLVDVLNFFISQCFDYETLNRVIALSSSFFSSANNPVTGILHETDSLYLVQSSNMIKSVGSTPYIEATQFLLTFSDILNNLICLYPDLRWYISGNNFILENISTLRNATFDVIDIVSGYPKYTQRQNEFSFVESEIPQVVKFENSNNKYFYFDDAKVEYQNTSTQIFTNLLSCYTDVAGLDIDLDSYSKENYFIVCCKNNTDTPKQIVYETIDFGQITESPVFSGITANKMTTFGNNVFTTLRIDTESGTNNPNDVEFLMSSVRQFTVGDRISINGNIKIEFTVSDILFYNFGTDLEYYIKWDEILSGTGISGFSGISRVKIYVIGNELDDLGEQEKISNILEYKVSDFTKSYYSGKVKTKFALDTNPETDVLTITESSPDARIVIALLTNFKVYTTGGYNTNGKYFASTMPNVICASYFKFQGFLMTDSQYNVLNNRLSFNYLLPKFFIEDQYASSGEINDKLVSFGSLRKIKKAKAKLQLSEVSDIIETNGISDTVGNRGEINQMRYSPIDKVLELDILHDIDRRDSNDNFILDINFTGLKSWYEENGTIYIYVTTSTDVSTIIPEILISKWAKISPSSQIEQDFTEPVEYIVTAESGLIAEYSFVVIKEEFSYTVSGNIPLGATQYNDCTFKFNSTQNSTRRCQLYYLDSNSLNGVEHAYLTQRINDTGICRVKFDNAADTYHVFLNYAYNSIDLEDFTGLTELIIIGSFNSILNYIMIPETSTIWTVLVINSTKATVLNWDAFLGTSDNININLTSNSMTPYVVDENLRQIAKKGWTGVLIDISSNSAPLSRIVFFEITSGGINYVVGDILNFIVFAGSGGYEDLATFKVLEVDINGAITNGIINAVGSEYAKEVKLSGGSGTGVNITGYPAKFYLTLKLGATVTTD